MARPAKKWALIDERLGDTDLAERLLYWRTAGVPANAMARLLTIKTGVVVSGETVRTWLRQLDGEAA